MRKIKKSTWWRDESFTQSFRYVLKTPASPLLKIFTRKTRETIKYLWRFDFWTYFKVDFLLYRKYLGVNIESFLLVYDCWSVNRIFLWLTHARAHYMHVCITRVKFAALLLAAMMAELVELNRLYWNRIRIVFTFLSSIQCFLSFILYFSRLRIICACAKDYPIMLFDLKTVTYNPIWFYCLHIPKYMRLFELNSTKHT